jgi:hypothetical protein
MKQTVTFKRTETVTVEVEVPEALSRDSYRAAAEGLLSVGAVTGGRTIGRVVTEWEPMKAIPDFPARQGANRTRATPSKRRPSPKKPRR